MSNVPSKKVTITLDVPVTTSTRRPERKAYKQDIKNLIWTFYDMNDLEGDPYLLAEAIWPVVKFYIKK